uniref:Uncharacterized protein n=1 Tax=Candidatus Methanogaster sp. ANME-2c ERB4 TaxID=2759911 RepID=A0A7G9Y6V3_9EURY|nr:hypothetical protein HIDCGLNP_00003 [Methanosarcinales archaeon ANME-2c ERB4]
MFGLSGSNLFSLHYNNSASFFRLVLLSPEAMHRVALKGVWKKCIPQFLKAPGHRLCLLSASHPLSIATRPSACAIGVIRPDPLNVGYATPPTSLTGRWRRLCLALTLSSEQNRACRILQHTRLRNGGKDGYPYPVDRDTYDQTIEVLRDAIEGAEIRGRRGTGRYGGWGSLFDWVGCCAGAIW